MDDFIGILLNFGISLIMLIVAGVLFVRNSAQQEIEAAQQEAEKKAKEKRLEYWHEQRIKKFNDWRDSIYKKCGNADVCLQVKQNEPDWTILIWQNNKFFYFNNEVV